MRILIDLQACQAERTQGFERGRYAMSLALAIAHNASPHEVWILLNDRFPGSVPAIRQTFQDLVPSQHIAVFSIPPQMVDAKASWLRPASELIREFFVAAIHPSVVYIPYSTASQSPDVVASIGRLPQFNIPTVATLDDSSNLSTSETTLRNQQKDAEFAEIEILRKSNLLLLVCEGDRSLAIDKLSLSASNIVNLSSASASPSKPSSFFPWDSLAKTTIRAFEDLVRRRTNQGTDIAGGELSKEWLYKKLISEISKLPGLLDQRDPKLTELLNSIAASFSFKQQLLVDISELVLRDARSGIQRVVRSILSQLLQNPPKPYEVVPVYWDGICYRQANRFISTLLPNFASDSFAHDAAKGETIDSLVDASCNDVFLGLDLTAQLILGAQKTLTRFRDLGVDIYFVVYDVLLIDHPEWFSQGASQRFIGWLEAVSKLSTGLVCISQATAEAVKNWLLYFPPPRADYLKIDHFHLGADIDQSLPSGGFPESAESVLVALQTAPTVLMVGTVEPRKGHTQALNAFNLLWQRGIEVNLVIVGHRGWNVAALTQQLDSHPELGRRLFWLKSISDEYLSEIYSASTVLLAASEGEGFGLPLIEAAQRQLPVIARDLSVFREVAGDHAFYFEGEQSEQLAAVVEKWLALYRKGDVPSSAGMPWLTWSESTQQLLNTILP